MSTILPSTPTTKKPSSHKSPGGTVRTPVVHFTSHDRDGPGLVPTLKSQLSKSPGIASGGSSFGGHNRMLSKSHDNLASALRKKAKQNNVASSTPASSATRPTKLPLSKLAIPCIRKSTSVQCIDTSSTGSSAGASFLRSPMAITSRAHSVQNICRIPVSVSARGTKVGTSTGAAVGPIKRGESLQNGVGGAGVGGGAGGVALGAGGHRRALRTSSVNAAAICNAELLANFEKEKKVLERRISELIQVAETRLAEAEKLKFEVRDLKLQQEELQRVSSATAASSAATATPAAGESLHEELALLRAENRLLRNHLHEHGLTAPTEPFTDNEKIYFLQQMSSGTVVEGGLSGEGGVGRGGEADGSVGSHHRPVSDGGDTYNLERELGQSVGDLSNITSRHTSDDYNLDRRSSLSIDRGLNDSSQLGGGGGRARSSGSVAYLYECIHQMQENHYSTNEELQATHQELSDLQTSVNELSSENERLADEKSILLESLCAQTEKLENSRLQVEHLKALLIRESEHKDRSDNEVQLVALVKSAEEERDEIILQQTELNSFVYAIETENGQLHESVASLNERIALVEAQVESLRADKRSGELQISELKKLLTGSIGESARQGKDEGMVGDARRTSADEGSALAGVRAGNTGDSTGEAIRFKQLVGDMGDVMQASKTNANAQVGRLEGTVERMKEEKAQLVVKVDQLQDELNVLQKKDAQSRTELRTLVSTVHSTEQDLETSKKLVEWLQVELQQTTDARKYDEEQWLQFQRDLQIAVVVANDFKTEVEESMDNVREENASLKERLSQLAQETSTLKYERDRTRARELESSLALSSASTVATSEQIRGKVISTVDREFATLRRTSNGFSTAGEQKGTTPLSPSQPTKSFLPSPKIQVKSDRKPLSPRRILPEPGKVTNIDSGEFKFPSVATTDSTSSSSAVLNQSKRLSAVDTILAKISPEDPPTSSVSSKTPDETRIGDINREVAPEKKSVVGILTNRALPRKSSLVNIEAADRLIQDKVSSSSPGHSAKSDPLTILAKQLGGSKRNALLKWCQNRTTSYSGIDITNFSSSWDDGLAFCALIHAYRPDLVPFKELGNQNKMSNFQLAFKATESVGITQGPNLNILIATDRPDWQAVFSYVTSIYKHFEVDNKS